MAEQIAKARVTVKKPTADELKSLGVSEWGIWTKSPSDFPWHYDEKETCYFLEGEVVVDTPEGQVAMKKGDLVTFPEGLSCTWHVKKAVKKHYRFG